MFIDNCFTGSLAYALFVHIASCKCHLFYFHLCRIIRDDNYVINNAVEEEINKGKDRKAKKAEQEAKKVEKERVKAHNIWQKWTHGIGKEGRKLIHCNHGFATIVPDENHPVFSFMDSFYINWESQMTL